MTHDARNASALLIRPATQADANAIVACIDRSFSHYVDRMGKPPRPMLYDYNEVLSRHAVYLACINEQIAGVLVLKPEVDRFNLDVVAVDPQLQGRGIGKQLIRFAETQAMTRGYGSIHLCTNVLMEENQAIYSKLGYTQYAQGSEDGYERVFFRKSLAIAHNLAQLNIATMKEAADSPVMAEFMANLDRINALAEAAPGFVWRLVGDPPENPFGSSTLVNLSVWRDVGTLSDFVHKSAHVEIMRRRREWFTRLAEASMVLWWVPAGHIPTVQEAAGRLGILRERGPTAEAFSFSSRFDPAIVA